jgi:ubiquinone/menaquinone biosynthesis C-methylase UbiE
LESVSWQSAHYCEPYATIRRNKVPGKLAKLGLLDLDRSATILDTCCGSGDALSILWDNGFRNLQGIDMTPPPEMAAHPFRIYAGSVTALPFADASFNHITNLHALHLLECRRVLKDGGTLNIIDFPASPQIKLLFFFLRHRLLTITGQMKNFADILDEEWSYLTVYLDQWPNVRRLLHEGSLKVKRFRQDLFLYYLTLVKE